eukprot:scaffold26988_cov197-Isochrysis_galbana.AAC.6
MVRSRDIAQRNSARRAPPSVARGALLGRPKIQKCSYTPGALHTSAPPPTVSVPWSFVPRQTVVPRAVREAIVPRPWMAIAKLVAAAAVKVTYPLEVSAWHFQSCSQSDRNTRPSTTSIWERCFRR